MPTVFYTPSEFAEVVAANDRLKTQLKAAESLRPQWAQGYASDSVAAQGLAVALQQLWGMLGAKNQTQAVALLAQLTGKT